MSTIKRILLPMAVVCGLSLPLAISTALAQQVISYQGYATDNGTALQNAHAVTLSIYKVSTGGSPVYTETQNTVTFTNGLFNVLIGSNSANPLPIFDAGDFAGKRLAQDYFLGIAIDNNPELSPRTQLGATSTSWSSRFADSARGAATAASSLTATTALTLTGGAVTSLNSLTGAVTLTGGGGTTVTGNGQTITISSSGGGGGTGIQGVQNTDGTINVTSPNGPTATITVNPSKVQLLLSGSVPVGNFVTGLNQSGNGSISSSAITASDLPSLAGDASGSYSATTVGKIQGVAVAPTAPSSGQVLTYNGMLWAPATPSGGISGSGTSNTLPLWSGTSSLANSKLTDNGTTLSYAGAHINSATDYEINGGTVLTNPGSNIFVGGGAGAGNTTGYDNAFVGIEAGQSNQGSAFNTFDGYTAGQNSNGNSNTFVGAYAGTTNTSGTNNTAVGEAANVGSASLTDATAIGHNAIAGQSYTVQLGDGNVTAVNTSGSYQISGTTVVSIAGGNTLLGYSAGNASMTGGANTFTGYQAGQSCTSGPWNTFVGNAAGNANTAGAANTFTGNGAGVRNTSGGYNTFMGNHAGYYSTTGNSNTCLGNVAGYGIQGQTTASSNTFVGDSAGYSNTTGGGNTFSGFGAGVANSTAGGNVFVGYFAGQANTTAGANTFVGYQAGASNTIGGTNSAFGNVAGPNSSDLTNTTCLGNAATATISNEVVLGNSYVTSLYCAGAYAATTASSANLVVSSSGQIMRSTSSARYKTNIRDLAINTDHIYDLRPVSYTSKVDGKEYFGLVAEEVAKAIPELAEYARERDVIPGSTSDKLIPDAVRYPMLSVLLLDELKKEHARAETEAKVIDDLTRRVEALEASQKAAR